MTLQRRGHSGGVLAFLVAALASCRATPPAVTPGAETIEVAKGDPPREAENLGPVEAVNGHGCGLYGAKGSYEGAQAELREQAAQRGGDYVQVVKATEPHVEGGCYDVRFILRGVVFRVKPAPAGAAVAAASPEVCAPPCSPGYACASGTCRAECNPACAANQTCGQDRTCRPTTP